MRLAPVLAVATFVVMPVAQAAGTNVYVANFGSNNVSQYRVAPDGTLAALSPASVPAGKHPWGVAVTPNAKNAYVANENSNTVSQYDINATTGKLTLKATVSAGGNEPEKIAVTPDGKCAFVPTEGTPYTVSQYRINAGTGELQTAGTAVDGNMTPVGIAVTPNSQYAYVTNEHANNISEYGINTATCVLTALGTVSVAPNTEPSRAIAVNPDGKSAYVPDYNKFTTGVVNQFDIGGGLLTGKAPPSVPAGVHPEGIAVTPDGTCAFVTNEGANTVSRYEILGGGGLNALAGPVATGTEPVEVAVTPDSQYAYVTNAAGNSVSEYKIEPGCVLARPGTVLAGTTPFGIAVRSSGFPQFWSDVTHGTPLHSGPQPDAMEFVNNGPVVFHSEDLESPGTVVTCEMEFGTTVVVNNGRQETRLALPFGVAGGEGSRNLEPTEGCTEKEEAPRVPTYFDTLPNGVVGVGTVASITIGAGNIATVHNLNLSVNITGTTFCTANLSGIQGTLANVTGGFVEENPPNLNLPINAIIPVTGAFPCPSSVKMTANFFVETPSTTTDTAFIG